MTITIEALEVPLRADEHQGLRVGNTRVPLERVINAHRQGASPEEIVDMYPTLERADVYAVVAWALRHLAVVDAYLRAREQDAEEVRRQLEAARMTRAGFKEELLARRGQDNAPAPQ